MSVRAHKLRKWSSFGHRFGHRSELPFTFEFLRCVHFVHDMFYFWHAALNKAALKIVSCTLPFRSNTSTHLVLANLLLTVPLLHPIRNSKTGAKTHEVQSSASLFWNTFEKHGQGTFTYPFKYGACKVLFGSNRGNTSCNCDLNRLCTLTLLTADMLQANLDMSKVVETALRSPGNAKESARLLDLNL